MRIICFTKFEKSPPEADQNWIENGWVMSKILYVQCPYLGIHTKYDRFWPINWANINICEWNQLYMKGKPKLHILYEYQLNTYVTVAWIVWSNNR